MEKNIEHEMEAGTIQGFIWIVIGLPKLSFFLGVYKNTAPNIKGTKNAAIIVSPDLRGVPSRKGF